MCIKSLNLSSKKLRKWRPYKATKIEVLAFIRERKIAGCLDLVDRFGLQPSSARWRLWALAKEGLIEPLYRGYWALTEEAFRKLDYFGKL